ncbi:protein of unknown function [Candidatus Methylomirabilis oxygeniifera]|uniref:Uncharacterized protein n=1 Tax=Methylomirabilis oxygeniifera TaxID=671143 RepID=D5MKZ9_METO1|nr:protein of unknown function [Candidatus Methylomirabilis oxyfera]
MCCRETSMRDRKSCSGSWDACILRIRGAQSGSNYLHLLVGTGELKGGHRWDSGGVDIRSAS